MLAAIDANLITEARSMEYLAKIIAACDDRPGSTMARRRHGVTRRVDQLRQAILLDRPITTLRSDSAEGAA